MGGDNIPRPCSEGDGCAVVRAQARELREFKDNVLESLGTISEAMASLSDNVLIYSNKLSNHQEDLDEGDVLFTRINTKVTENEKDINGLGLKVDGFKGEIKILKDLLLSAGFKIIDSGDGRSLIKRKLDRRGAVYSSLALVGGALAQIVLSYCA